MSVRVAGALRARGWRAGARQGDAAIFIAATHPTTSALVVGIRVLGHHWKHNGRVHVVVEPAVGLEAAMDLAVRLGVPATRSWFFAQHPDRPSNQLTTSSTDAKAVVDWVDVTAARLIPQWADRYDGVDTLLAAMQTQPRLDVTDHVLARALVLAATGRPGQASSLLSESIDRVDPNDRRGRGWQEMAARVNERMAKWINEGQPPPASWDTENGGSED